jgi:hypothetical protein
MGRPLNFYQFNTGVFSSGTSGVFTVINPLFGDMLTGVFSTQAIIDQRVDGKFVLDEDFYNTPIYPNAEIYAKLNSTNSHFFSIDNQINGKFLPALAESGAVSYSFTGQIVSDNIDSNDYRLCVTGSLSSGNIDKIIFCPQISGKIPTNYYDKSILCISITGSVLSGQADKLNNYVCLSGRCIPKDKDSLSSIMTFYSVSWSGAHGRVIETSGDSLVMGIEMNAVYWFGSNT